MKKFIVSNTNEDEVRFSILNRGAEIMQGQKDVELTGQYTVDELVGSVELRAALAAGTLEAKDENGASITLDQLQAEPAIGDIPPVTKTNNPLNPNKTTAADLSTMPESISASGKKFPTSSHGNPIKKDMTFRLSDDGNLGNVPVKKGSTVTALIDNPGQIEANWKVNSAPVQ